MKTTDSTKGRHYRPTMHKFNIRTVPGLVNHLHIETLIDEIGHSLAGPTYTKEKIKKIRRLNRTGAKILEQRHRKMRKALEELCRAFLGA